MFSVTLNSHVYTARLAPSPVINLSKQAFNRLLRITIYVVDSPYSCAQLQDIDTSSELPKHLSTLPVTTLIR